VAGSNVSISGSWPNQTISSTAAGGDVVGPASATDNALARFDTTTGELIQNSVAILDDSGNLTGIANLTVNDNTILGSSNSDTVTFTARVNSDIDPSTDNAYDLGRNSHAWRNLYLTGTANIAALSASGAVTLSGGTASGVAYLNGSKVLTSGSALTFDGTNFATTGSVTSAGASNSGNLAFTGTGNRITGDFSNATVANRVAFQSSTTNGNTIVGAIPNGTGVTSVFRAFNAADPTNAGQATIGLNVSSAFFDVGVTGTGTFLPLTFNVGGSERLRIDTAGNINIPTLGARITGDFSNATIANRVAFQSTTTNGATSLSLLPNGSSIVSGINCYGATDPANSNAAQFAVINGGDARIQATANGTASAIPMTFYTGASERVRIDTSGNVGIGTSSPGAKLAVADGSVRLLTNNNRSTLYGINRGDTGSVNGMASIGMFGSGTNGYLGNITFSTAGSDTFDSAVTERMRIDSSGNLLVGGTSQVGSGRVGINFGASGDGIALTSSGTADRSPLVFFNDNGFVGRVSTSGSSTAYLTSSDYRLKHDIQPMTGALAKVAALKPVTYKWNADDSQSQGFIAHELQEVVPECVTGEKDAVDAEGKPQYQGIDTSFLVATLTAAIQELKAELDTVKAELATLKGTQP
jgi:hypothetical protein